MLRASAVAVDLGTSTTQVWAAGDVIRLPSLVVVDHAGRTSVGDDIRAMRGRMPRHMRLLRPLARGVVQDVDSCSVLLAAALRAAGAGRRSRVCIGVPAGASEVERRSVTLACERAIGRGPARIVSEPVAAAVGASLPVDDVVASMVLDVGEGITESMVVAAGGVVAVSSRRVGGADVDGIVARHVHDVYRLAIGDATAERLKVSIGDSSAALVAGGRDVRTGLPARVEVDRGRLADALVPAVDRMVATAVDALGRTSPELCGDLVDRGIAVVGGGAMLPGLTARLEAVTGLPARLADRGGDAVLRGNVRVLTGEAQVVDRCSYRHPLR